MGLTQWFGLRKPTDPAAPADFITIVGALADDTDAALKRELDGKAGSGHGHGSVPYANSAGNADTVDGHHFQGADRGESLPYLWGSGDGGGDNRLMHVSRLGWSHGHNPSQSGIGVIHHNFGSLAAGQTKSQAFGRSNDQYPVVSVNHASTYILAVIASLWDGGFSVEVRNSTSSTNHTNVHVIVHLVRAA
jgi:hypothetical protein